MAKRTVRGFEGVRVATLGHSARSLEELLELIEAFGVRVVADIRRFPRSRRNPHFNLEVLPAALRSRGVEYAHLVELGGRRRAQPDSLNGGWKNESFRGFADYMQTPEFERALESLRALSVSGKVGLMCAEAVPWRCHRTLISDALLARGAEVENITSRSRATPHRLTRFAQLEGARVTYPPEVASGADAKNPLPAPAARRK